MKQGAVRDKTRATTVATEIVVADTFLLRLIGLLERRRMDAEVGLWIRPSSGVHMFGMLFATDVVAFDRHQRICAGWHELRPWRISGISGKIHSVLELLTGTIPQKGIEIEDQLEFLPSASACTEGRAPRCEQPPILPL